MQREKRKNLIKLANDYCRIFNRDLFKCYSWVRGWEDGYTVFFDFCAGRNSLGHTITLTLAYTFSIEHSYTILKIYDVNCATEDFTVRSLKEKIDDWKIGIELFYGYDTVFILQTFKTIDRIMSEQINYIKDKKFEDVESEALFYDTVDKKLNKMLKTIDYNDFKMNKRKES